MHKLATFRCLKNRPIWLKADYVNRPGGTVKCEEQNIFKITDMSDKFIAKTCHV